MKLKRKGRKGNNSSIGFLLLFLSVLVFSFVLMSFEANSQKTVSALEKIAGKKAVKKPKKVDIGKEKKSKEERDKYSYNPKGKRDPFKPFISKVEEEKKKGAWLTPLQKYKFDQLKLIGIVWEKENKSPIAMVEDPEGKGYVLKKGTLIGEKNGRVIDILKDRVVIRETYRDYFGKIKEIKTFLKLHRTEEGEKP